MSDSLFLDPFAQPPSDGTARAAAPDAKQVPDEAPASLAAEVPLAADRAVEAFLEYVHLWWPVALRACGEDGHLGFEEGTLLEEGLDGSRHRWADVVGTEGASLSLRWFGAPGGQAASTGLDVTLEFTIASATQTLVTVRGSGVPSFRRDWHPVLDGYARFAGGTVRPVTA
ncbi:MULTISPECIES: hypothetical protein [Micrococcaceae]|uniref:hypothetical protein n=1 Tax=Micrococcaceae TaxID=1268 RepID=UPI0016180293|nr:MULTISPECIES: hypothetical protein [Micrococcaceae]MBB5747788.1 hypothetical protein [Micrococcus sp. TA1]HRO30544.1 hypothetical protein [Citricoccus sp.]HRO93840.1 hypothetical protein [Citricoccus sp.]